MNANVGDELLREVMTTLTNVVMALSHNRI